MTIDDINLLKPEQVLKITLRGGSVSRSKVFSINDKEIVILQPVSEGSPKELKSGQAISVNFWSDECFYEFESEVLSVLKNPLSVAVLKYPKDILRIQRRRFYRIRLFDAKLTYAELNKSKKEIDGALINISGGGLCFISNDEYLELGDEISIKVSLPSFVFKSNVKIIRKTLKESGERKIYEFCVDFQNIDEADRAKIIKFVFDKQTESRK